MIEPQQKQNWSETDVITRFQKAFKDWMREKPTGDLTFKIDARCGGINKILISPTICEYSCTQKN